MAKRLNFAVDTDVEPALAACHDQFRTFITELFYKMAVCSYKSFQILSRLDSAEIEEIFALYVK